MTKGYVIDVSRVFLVFSSLIMIILFAYGLLSERNLLVLTTIGFCFLAFIDSVRISDYKKWYDEFMKEVESDDDLKKRLEEFMKIE